MTDEIRQAISRQQDAYRSLFQVHGRSEEALCWSKNKQTTRFAALTRFMPDRPAVLLDYGCGLGDLKPWLQQHRPAFRYAGVDVLDEFIESNRRHYGSGEFLRIQAPDDVPGTYDHCAISGVFNLRTSSEEVHAKLIQHTLAVLFDKVTESLACDFLSPDTTYRQEHSHHQEVPHLVNFLRGLSPRYIIDRSYLPYEYCVTIFKDRAVDGGRTVYQQEVGRSLG